MFCTRCGNAMEDAAQVCPACGATTGSAARPGLAADPGQVAAGSAAAAPGPAPTGVGPAGMWQPGVGPAEMWQPGVGPAGMWQPGSAPGGPPGAYAAVRPARARGASRVGDLVAGLALAVVMAALFLPWYVLTVTPGQHPAPPGVDTAQISKFARTLCTAQPHASACGHNNGSYALAALGVGAAGWRYAILAVGVLVVVYLLIRLAGPVARLTSSFHWPLLTALTVVEAALVGVAWWNNPLDVFSFTAVISWGAGAYTAAGGAVVAVAGGILAGVVRRGRGAGA